MNKIELQPMGTETGCRGENCPRTATVYVRVWIGAERSSHPLCLMHTEMLIDRRAGEL